MAVTWITPTELTIPTTEAWADCDVSALVPAGSTGVILHSYNADTGNDYLYGFRKNGSTDNRPVNLKYNGQTWLIVGVDANRVFEYYLQNNTDCHVFLVGYTNSESVLFTNAVDKSLTTTTAWTDIDISSDTGTDTAIGAFFEINQSVSGNNDYGLRKNGSTDSRINFIPQSKFGCFAGVDANEVCEGYIGSVDTDFFLQGYIKSGATFLANATDISLTSTYGYSDLTALPSGATGGFIEVIHIITGYNNFALRKKGASEDIYRYARQHSWAAVQCNDDRVIEGRISTDTTDFFLTGYTTAGAEAQTISIAGIASGAAIGTITMTPGSVTLALSGISSTVTIGTPTLVTSGAPQTLSLDGITSASAIGSPTMVPGAITVSVNGIGSATMIGTPTMVPGVVTLSLNGISSGATLGAITLSPGAVTLAVAGAITAASSISASLTATKSLAGVVASDSTISATLTIARSLVGAIASASSIGAALSKAVYLSGAVNAQSSIGGALTAEKALQGEISASSSMVASISVYKALAGQVRGSTDMSATLTKRVGLAGAITSQSNIIADLLVVVPAPIYVSGAIPATSVISANLTVVSPDIELEGDFITEIPLTGDFVTGVTLAGEFVTGITLEGGIEMAKTVQDFEMYAGEDKTITIPVADVGAIVSASWKLCEKVKYTDLITKNSTVPADLTIAGDSLIITLVPDDTEELDGKYYHEARVTDSVGRTETVAVGTGTIYRTAHDPE